MGELVAQLIVEAVMLPVRLLAWLGFNSFASSFSRPPVEERLSSKQLEEKLNQAWSDQASLMVETMRFQPWRTPDAVLERLGIWRTDTVPSAQQLQDPNIKARTMARLQQVPVARMIQAIASYLGTKRDNNAKAKVEATYGVLGDVLSMTYRAAQIGDYQTNNQIYPPVALATVKEGILGKIRSVSQAHCAALQHTRWFAETRGLIPWCINGYGCALWIFAQTVIQLRADQYPFYTGRRASLSPATMKDRLEFARPRLVCAQLSITGSYSVDKYPACAQIPRRHFPNECETPRSGGNQNSKGKEQERRPFRSILERTRHFN